MLYGLLLWHFWSVCESFGPNVLIVEQLAHYSDFSFSFDDKLACAEKSLFFPPYIFLCLMGQKWKNNHCYVTSVLYSFYRDPFSIPSVLPSVPKILALLPYCSSHFLFILQGKTVPHLHPNIYLLLALNNFMRPFLICPSFYYYRSVLGTYVGALPRLIKVSLKSLSAYSIGQYILDASFST